MRHVEQITIWEYGDRVLTSRGSGVVVRAPGPIGGMQGVIVDVGGEDWCFDAWAIQPAPGQEISTGPYRCQHVGPALSMPGEQAKSGPCLYCGLAFEEWESQR